jgi:hypothetical protein
MVKARPSMKFSLQIVRFGDELGIVLSEEFLVRHGLKVGDELQLTETSHGFELTSESMKQAAAARKVMLKYSDVLRRLAE